MLGKLPCPLLKVIVSGANPSKTQRLAKWDGSLVVTRMTAVPVEELVRVSRLLEEIRVNQSILEGHFGV